MKCLTPVGDIVTCFTTSPPRMVGVVVKALEGREERQGLEEYHAYILVIAFHSQDDEERRKRREERRKHRDGEEGEGKERRKHRDDDERKHKVSATTKGV